MCFFAVMSRSYYLFKRSPSFECNVFPHKIFCFRCRCRHHTRVTNDYNGAAFLTSPNRSYHLKITSVSSPKSSWISPPDCFLRLRRHVTTRTVLQSLSSQEVPNYACLCSNCQTVTSFYFSHPRHLSKSALFPL